MRSSRTASWTMQWRRASRSSTPPRFTGEARPAKAGSRRTGSTTSGRRRARSALRSSFSADGCGTVALATKSPSARRSASAAGAPKTIARALRESLDRLGTDHVDVHKMHAWDPDTPIDETIAGMSAGVEAGQVGIIGCSNYSAAQIQAALNASAKGGYARFEIMQPPYNLARPPTVYGHTAREEVEGEILPLCRREGIAVTPYSPLGAGFLAGKYINDKSKLPSLTRFRRLSQPRRHLLHRPQLPYCRKASRQSG